MTHKACYMPLRVALWVLVAGCGGRASATIPAPGGADFPDAALARDAATMVVALEASVSEEVEASVPAEAAPVCVNGALRCNGLQPQTCAHGQWENSGPPCPFVCGAGTCAGPCRPTSTQCSGGDLACNPGTRRCSDNDVQTCGVDTRWGAPVPCINQACISGLCYGQCAPKARRCNGPDLELCDIGIWSSIGTVAGECGAVCTRSSRRCDGYQHQTCNSTGAWQNDLDLAGECGVVDAATDVDGWAAADAADAGWQDTSIIPVSDAAMDEGRDGVGTVLCEAGLPVTECVQYFTLLSQCTMSDQVRGACQPSAIPKTPEELMRIRALCAINLQRLQEACR